MSPKTKRRLGAAVTLCLIAVATGCSSPTPSRTPTPASASPVTFASPDASSLSLFYLQPLRGSAGLAAKRFPHFATQQSSDAKLIAVAKEACTDLQSHAPTGVVNLLKQEGWTGPEAVEIITSAANPDTFCPGQYQKVEAWIRANTGG